MNEEQYNEMKKYLSSVLANQTALAKKIDTLQSDVSTIINNQLITGRDQDKLIKMINEIKAKI